MKVSYIVSRIIKNLEKGKLNLALGWMQVAQQHCVTASEEKEQNKQNLTVWDLTLQVGENKRSLYDIVAKVLEQVKPEYLAASATKRFQKKAKKLQADFRKGTNPHAQSQLDVLARKHDEKLRSKKYHQQDLTRMLHLILKLNYGLPKSSNRQEVAEKVFKPVKLTLWQRFIRWWTKPRGQVDLPYTLTEKTLSPGGEEEKNIFSNLSTQAISSQLALRDCDVDRLGLVSVDTDKVENNCMEEIKSEIKAEQKGKTEQIKPPAEKIQGELTPPQVAQYLIRFPAPMRYHSLEKKQEEKKAGSANIPAALLDLVLVRQLQEQRTEEKTTTNARQQCQEQHRQILNEMNGVLVDTSVRQEIADTRKEMDFDSKLGCFIQEFILQLDPDWFHFGVRHKIGIFISEAAKEVLGLDPDGREKAFHVGRGLDLADLPLGFFISQAEVIGRKYEKYYSLCFSQALYDKQRKDPACVLKMDLLENQSGHDQLSEAIKVGYQGLQLKKQDVIDTATRRYGEGEVSAAFSEFAGAGVLGEVKEKSCSFKIWSDTYSYDLTLLGVLENLQSLTADQAMGYLNVFAELRLKSLGKYGYQQESGLLYNSCRDDEQASNLLQILLRYYFIYLEREDYQELVDPAILRMLLQFSETELGWFLGLSRTNFRHLSVDLRGNILAVRQFSDLFRQKGLTLPGIMQERPAFSTYYFSQVIKATSLAADTQSQCLIFEADNLPQNMVMATEALKKGYRYVHKEMGFGHLVNNREGFSGLCDERIRVLFKMTRSGNCHPVILFNDFLNFDPTFNDPAQHFYADYGKEVETKFKYLKAIYLRVVALHTCLPVQTALLQWRKMFVKNFLKGNDSRFDDLNYAEKFGYYQEENVGDFWKVVVDFVKEHLIYSDRIAVNPSSSSQITKSSAVEEKYTKFSTAEEKYTEAQLNVSYDLAGLNLLMAKIEANKQTPFKNEEKSYLINCIERLNSDALRIQLAELSREAFGQRIEELMAPIPQEEKQSDSAIPDEVTLLAYVREAIFRESQGKVWLRCEQVVTILLGLNGMGYQLIQSATSEGKTYIIFIIALIKAIRGQQQAIVTHTEMMMQEAVNKLQKLAALFNVSLGSSERYTITDKQVDVFVTHIDEGVLSYCELCYTGEVAGKIEREVIVDEVDHNTLFLQAQTSMQLTDGEEKVSENYLNFLDMLLDNQEQLRRAGIQNISSQLTTCLNNECYGAAREYYNSRLREQPKLQQRWFRSLSKLPNLKLNEDYVVVKGERNLYRVHIMHKDTSGVEDVRSKWAHGVHDLVSRRAYRESKGQCNVVVESLGAPVSTGDVVTYIQAFERAMGFTGTVGQQDAISLMLQILKAEKKEAVIIPRAKRDAKELGSSVSVGEQITDEVWPQVRTEPLSSVEQKLQPEQPEKAGCFPCARLFAKKNPAPSAPNAPASQVTKRRYLRRFDFFGYKPDVTLSRGMMKCDNKREQFSQLLTALRNIRFRQLSVLVFWDTIKQCSEFHTFLVQNEIKTDIQIFDGVVSEVEGRRVSVPQETVVRNAGNPNMITITTSVGSRGVDFSNVDCAILTTLKDPLILEQTLSRVGRNGQRATSFAILHDERLTARYTESGSMQTFPEYDRMQQRHQRLLSAVLEKDYSAYIKSQFQEYVFKKLQADDATDSQRDIMWQNWKQFLNNFDLYYIPGSKKQPDLLQQFSGVISSQSLALKLEMAPRLSL